MVDAERSGISVRRRRAISAVPDDILEDRRLSLRARTVLGWMVGRPAGWVIRVTHMCHVLGMSEHVWAAIREEISVAGYYRQWRERDEAGRIVWVREVSDTPAAPPSPKPSRMDAARDGTASHGGVGDIPACNQHYHLPPPPPESNGVEINQAVDDEEAGRRAAIANGTAPPVNNWSAWRRRLAERAEAGEDITTELGRVAAQQRALRAAEEEERKAARPRAKRINKEALQALQSAVGLL